MGIADLIGDTRPGRSILRRTAPRPRGAKEIIACLKALKLSSAAEFIEVAARFRHIASTKWGSSSPNAIDSSALR